MRRKLPKYVSGFRTASGKWRYQFRRKGHPRYYFKSKPWTAEFMEEYHSCMSGMVPPALQPGEARTPPGSLSLLIATYYGSAAYRNLAPSTQAVYRRILEGLRASKGDKRVATLRRRHVARMVDAKADTPHAANRLLKLLRMLMAYAVSNDWIELDPTSGVKFLKTKGGGIHTWTEGELEQFMATHGPGTKARLAMSLMLYTGQRLSDAIRMGWQHVNTKTGRIYVIQQKSGGETRLDIPLHPDLAAILAGLPKDNMTFLTTHMGKPYTAKGFGNRMRQWCDLAGLPQCSSHGLRKLMGARLAEAGASTHEIASILGHKSLQEAQKYTVAAEQRRLAGQAFQKLSHEVNLGDKNGEKSFIINT